MKKRVAAAALSIVMLLGMLPAQAFAVSDRSEQSEPDYKVGSTITDGENQYTVKEYITGGRPLVLNYQVKNNTKVIMDVDVSNATSGFLIGSGEGTDWSQSSSRFGLFVRSNPQDSSQRRVEYSVGTSNTLPIADYGNEVYTSQKIQVSLSTTEAKIVGAEENPVTVQISGQTIAEGNTTNLALFAINYSGGIQTPEQSTGVNLYGMQIWEGEELKMNLLPVQATQATRVVHLGDVRFTVTDAEGLYDTVTKSFYASSAVESGSCELQIEEGASYEDNNGETYNRIASIDPNGADYIDTTYLPNADTEITAVYDPAGMSMGWLFHSDCTWGDSGLGYMASASVRNAGAYTFGKVAVTSSNNKSDSIARVTLNADKIEVESVTGTVISTALSRNQSAAFTSPAPLRLFALNRTSGQRRLETLNGGKLFYLEIKEKGEYVHKMYPVERASDNFPGLFDTVTKEFYPFDTPKGIQITSLPTKRFYTTGEPFNAAGMIVSLLWNSGETTLIPTNAVVTSTDTEDMSTTGTKTVTVSYVRGSKTYQATFTIEVVESVSSLVIHAVAQSGGNRFEVKNEKGNLFLPSGLTFYGSWDGGETVTYDRQEYASGELPLVPGGEYRVGRAPINLNIYSSGSSENDTAISTIFITDVDLGHVHEKGNESGGNLIKVSADGSQIIVPKDEAESSAGNLDSIKGRGNTSFTGSGNKKPYSVKLDNKAELIAGNKSKKWNLITIYAAHGASVENAMQIFDLTRALRENGMDSPIDFEPVNLYINGEYRGVYMLTEKVEISGNVIKISDLEDYDVTTDENAVARTTGTLDVQDSTVTYAYRANAAYDGLPADITGGYLLEVDDPARIEADAACYIKTAKGISIAIKSPENATEEMVKYIATYVQEFENALMSPSGYNADGKHYSEYIDMQSMVANYLVEAFAQDVDYGFSSWYFYKDTNSNGGKLNGGIIWDMDGTGRLQGNDPSVLLPARVENDGNTGSVWIKQLLTKGDFMSLLYETNKTVFKSAVADIVNDTAGLRTRTLASATLDRMKWGDGLYGNVTLSAGRSAWEEWLVIRNSSWFGTLFNENSRLLGAAISQDGNTLSADIDGVATSYQWYTVDPSTYELTEISDATAATYTLEAAGRYVLAATGTNPRGVSETMYSAAIDAKMAEPTPNATFTATGPDTGTLSGVENGMKYQVGDGQWVDITSSNDITLTGLTACTISVVKKGKDTTTTDSAAQTITVTKAATPSLTPEQPSTIGGKGSIPTTTDHEYSTNGSSYTACTGELNNLDAGTYYVRVKATGTVLASDPQTITITEYNPGGSPSSGGSSKYTVSVPNNVSGGTVTVSPKSASKNDTVMITIKPDEGYVLDKLAVTDKNGKKIELTDKGNGMYTFTMPASKVTIESTFVEVEQPAVNPFIDVEVGDYFYDAVLWAVEKGITNGTNAAGTTFSPDVEVSRAQMVTFLWRAHGAPKADGANPFTDVSESDYYYDAVLWAVANGVTKGTSATTFSPDMDVSRAQAVTFQWRAAGASEASGSSFDDVAADAWYTDAVTWAVANEITNGTGGNHFSPDVVVTRAQAVTFLYRELA